MAGTAVCANEEDSVNLACLTKVAAAAALMCSVLTAGATAQEARKLTYASFYGSNDFYETSSKYFMDEVTRRSGGRIQFETYYGGSLLKTADMSPGLSRGVADMAVAVPAAFNPREFPLSGVVLPFISENPKAVTYAFAKLYETSPELQEEYRRQNQKLLWAIGSGENSLWTNKPIERLEDLKGARVRAIIGVADALKALGGTPISIPWVEALELVQRGGAEGVSGTPFNQAVVTKVHEMAPYGSNSGRMGSYTIVTWGLNLDTWNSFDAETKRIFEEVSGSVIDQYFSLYEAEVDRAVDMALKSEAKIVHIDDAESQRWAEIARPVVHKKWIDSVRGKTKDPEKLLADFVSLVRQYEAEYPYKPGFDRLREKQR